MSNAINSFTGEFRFLSNFYPLVQFIEFVIPGRSIEYDGCHFQTVEAAYQSAKSTKEIRHIFTQLSAKDAKILGQHVQMRPEFQSEKLSIMEDLVRQKFTRFPYPRQKLVETDDVELIEGNTWGDKFWGVCDGEGENHLGKILMKIRSELQTT